MNSQSDTEQTAAAMSLPLNPDAQSMDMPDEELLYDLADLFKVFSDTTRIKILFALMGNELCVADIAEKPATPKVPSLINSVPSNRRISFASREMAEILSTHLPTTTSTPCSTRA